MEETIIVSFVKKTDENMHEFIEDFRQYILDGYEEDISDLRIIEEDVTNYIVEDLDGDSY